MPIASFGPFGSSIASLRPSRPDRLRIAGLVGRPSELAYEDLAALPAAHQIEEVASYAQGFRGRAVRVDAVLAHVDAKPEALYLNVGTRDGSRRLALFRREAGPLALIVYARDGRPLGAAEGGPFQWVLPGFHDGARELADLGWIQVAKRAGKDDRARFVHRPQAVIGRQAFESGAVWRDPREHDTFVIPPP